MTNLLTFNNMSKPQSDKRICHIYTTLVGGATGRYRAACPNLHTGFAIGSVLGDAFEDIVDDAQAYGGSLTFSMLNSVGRAIVVGEFAERPFPTEAVLAKQYGLSRSVTREAIKMLCAKGLLSARPRKGTAIQPVTRWNLLDTDVLRWMLDRKFSPDLLREFSELRIAIEPEAAAMAALRATPSDLAAIDQGLARMQAADEGLDDTLEADIAFHIAILRASKNPFFQQFRDMVSTALQTSIRFTNRLRGRSASVSDHATVRDAIQKRDPDAARTAMRTLIGGVFELLDAADTAKQKS
jgi:DNA-binding FadR family transcriptional regulator